MSVLPDNSNTKNKNNLNIPYVMCWRFLFVNTLYRQGMNLDSCYMPKELICTLNSIQLSLLEIQSDLQYLKKQAQAKAPAPAPASASAPAPAPAPASASALSFVERGIVFLLRASISEPCLQELTQIM